MKGAWGGEVLDRIIKIKNGDRLVDFRIYKCDKCGREIKEYWPHLAENNNTNHYCGECAFKAGKITPQQYVKKFLYFLGEGVKADLNPETGGVEITYGKFSWEMKDRDYRHSAQYSEWRNKIFERDDYICQICGMRGGELEAHHVKSFKKYKAERFDVDNGVTLCRACHRRVHKNKDGKWLYSEKKKGCG